MTRKSDEIGRGNHGYVVECEYPKVEVRASEVYSNSCRDKRPEDVATFRCRAGAAKADPQKMERMDALPPTFAFWLDAPSYAMSIVIVCR